MTSASPATVSGDSVIPGAPREPADSWRRRVRAVVDEHVHE
ncbi:hypothetical protein [Pseudokineococcus sp. 1T1Z-3]